MNKSRCNLYIQHLYIHYYINYIKKIIVQYVIDKARIWSFSWQFYSFPSFDRYWDNSIQINISSEQRNDRIALNRT